MNAADRVNKTNKYLSTTDVCREANVTRGQLRLYERDGLLVAPIRSGSGYRKYNLEVLDRLKAIQSLKELGLTLSEIAGLLSERDYIGLDASKIQQKAADMLLKTESRIARLQIIKCYLEKFVSGDLEAINDPDCKFMTEFLSAGPLR